MYLAVVPFFRGLSVLSTPHRYTFTSNNKSLFPKSFPVACIHGPILPPTVYKTSLLTLHTSLLCLRSPAHPHTFVFATTGRPYYRLPTPFHS
ncbi:hypothetical protein E2C01_086348 [Portunus trituberculatus]|uniref:Uncharacterized protein n=1 Tax=Portunus trituberculatus TaxID=210409 RepID=A0A5B7J0J3_PORTR|nr:hypothetical protein [Portunus trituberculatus]